MKTVEKINITRANNEVITVEVERNFTAQKSSISFALQNVITELVIKENRKCLKISKYAILQKEVRLALERTLNCKLPDGDIYITITDDSYSKLEQIRANFSKEVEDFNADFEARASKMNKFYVMYKFLDYTDYAINDIREIRVYREAMSDENIDKVLVKTYKLDNLSDENLRKEFDNDFNSAESLSLNDKEVKISEKVAEKWINVSENKENEIKVAEESKKTAQMLDLQKIEEEKESKKRDSLRKAIETGEKVVIVSYFVQGNDIPKKFRKSDSDMGEYMIYAMPDGTIKEEFIHAY